MNSGSASSETKEIALQRDLPLMSHAVAFYTRKGFTVTYSSTIDWKKLQYCDWHWIFSRQVITVSRGNRIQGKNI